MKLSVHTYTDKVVRYEVDSGSVNVRDLGKMLANPEIKWVRIDVVGGAVLIKAEEIHRIEISLS